MTLVTSCVGLGHLIFTICDADIDSDRVYPLFSAQIFFLVGGDGLVACGGLVWEALWVVSRSEGFGALQ